MLNYQSIRPPETRLLNRRTGRCNDGRPHQPQHIRPDGPAIRRLGYIPAGERVYVSIDIDSFDPSVAPGTATISCGGFTYCEGEDILREVARRFDVVGVDFVEVSSPCDPSGITSLLAARTSIDFIGSIFHERARRRA
ncbi:arginase family protein [Bradyrhizobium sp.]|uniref:arginase family protein n=1 Tax=Bradyrhizobium sp. TaxID=376 RepID=UPI003D0EB9D8